MVLVAVALLLLGHFRVVPVPWSRTSEALASEAADGDSKDKKDKKKDGEEEEVPVPVELAVAGSRPIAAFYRASSVVEADRHVNLVAKTAGRVRKVNVEEGDWVHQGDVLAELENDRERIRLRQEELRLDESQRDLDRSRSLLESSLVTQEDFEGVRSAFELAETERDLARVQLEDTQVRAPFDGQVTERLVVPGQHINLSEPLFTLVDFSPLRVRIHLPEAIAQKVRAGDRVTLDVETTPDPVPAVVERVAPVVDPSTSTVRVTLRVDGRAEDLRVGGFVKVRITTDTHAEALSVPKLALVEEGGLRSVFVAESDSVRKVEVRTGLYDESHVEILDGLRDGELVVSLGQGGLRTGSRIDVLNAEEVGWVAPDEDEEAAPEAESIELAAGQPGSPADTTASETPGEPQDGDE